MKPSRVPANIGWVALALTLGFLTLSTFWPLAVLITRFLGSSQTVLTTFFDVFPVVRATLSQAMWSTAVSAVLGLGLGLWAGRLASVAQDKHSQKCVSKCISLGHFFLSIPYGVPTIVAATAWISWLGRHGYFAQIGIPLEISYRFQAVILAHVFFNAPWVAYWVSQARTEIPQEELDAAQSLGAGVLCRFRFVIFPRIKWTFFSATLQVFMLCVMSFALVLILGGGPPVQTLETALYSRMRYGSLDMPGAMACGLWQLLVTGVPWLALLWFQKKKALNPSRNSNESFRVAQASSRSLIQSAVFLWVAALFVIPYVAVFSGGKALSLLTARYLSEISLPLLISFKLALGTAAGACVVALLAVLAISFVQGRTSCASRASTLLGFVVSLPSSISVLVLGLGFWIAYADWIDPFEGSFVAMLILQVTLFMPVAFRVFWPIAQNTAHFRLSAAETLGASPLTAFRYVEFPRWRAPVLRVFAMIAAGALGEVAAVSLFYSEKLVPLPLVISRWMGQYRFEEAQALSAFLLAASVAVMAGVQILGGKNRDVIR